MTLLGERQVIVDCDVLQADGGTRTASICGAYIALHDALTRVQQNGLINKHPLHSLCAAVSVGIHNGVPILDLPYIEDSSAEVDMNVVMLQEHGSSEAKFVEVQGTAEGTAFSQSQLTELLALATNGLREVFALQTQILSVPPTPRPK
jgi:ribonuclease PH